MLSTAAKEAGELARGGKKLAERVNSSVSRVEKAALTRITEASEAAAETATREVTARSECAEQLLEKVTRLEGRQLWSVAAAMFLTLLPVAVVFAGVLTVLTSLITGWQWATAVDWDLTAGQPWQGIGRVLVVSLGTAGALWALFLAVRWVAGLVETWRGRGTPELPRWEK